MAKITTITNPLTGQPAQVDQLDHTAQQIDDGLNIARGVSNPNLLDNWYFGNPVNQRGFTTADNVLAYTIDRWKQDLDKAGAGKTVTLNPNYLTLLCSNTASGAYVEAVQYIEHEFAAQLVGKTVTVSVLTDKGLFSKPMTLVDGVYGEVPIGENGTCYMRVNTSGYSGFRLRARYGEPVNVIACKLELGSQQTLAHQENGVWVLNEIPDYGEQLARCQRYFIRFNFGRNDLFFGSLASTLDKAWITIPTPVVMRTAPSVSFSTTFNVVIRGNGFQLEARASNSTVAADTSTSRCCNILITPNTKPSAWTAQQVVMIYTSSPWYMDCTSDL